MPTTNHEQCVSSKNYRNPSRRESDALQGLDMVKERSSELMARLT